MKLYLIEKSNDIRTWVYPEYNTVTATLYGVTTNRLEIEENENGEIYIEQYTDFKSGRKWYVRISASGHKSVNSDWLKRFIVLK